MFLFFHFLKAKAVLTITSIFKIGLFSSTNDKRVMLLLQSKVLQIKFSVSTKYIYTYILKKQLMMNGAYI